MNKIIRNRKELSKTFYDCKCPTPLIGIDYCKKCQQAVLDFLNEHGAGTLMGDLIIEELRKENEPLNNEILSLNSKVQRLTETIDKMRNKL